MRKSPRQERSRATVRAILEAAARVFVESGLEGATTNRIAEVAGVSVGSLYQYFPNKESLVRALLASHVADADARRPAVLASEDLALRDRIRIAFAWHLDVHAADPALHEMLTSAAPRVLGEDALRDFKRAYHGVMRSVLEPYRDVMRPRDLDLAAFVVAECMEALTHGAVCFRPDLLSRSDLIDEATELLAGYLEAGGAREAKEAR